MKSGFSIIEATLAVVVVAAGVLSVFMLFSAGLDLGAPAVADTTCAMFADSVLNGLRAESEHAAEGGHTNWLTFWSRFKDGDSGLTLPAYEVLVGSTNNLVEVAPLSTNIVAYLPFHGASDLSGVYEALRYRVTVEWRTQTTNDFFTDLLTNRTAVTLKVWPGEHGSTNDNDALIFYTHFRYNGTL